MRRLGEVMCLIGVWLATSPAFGAVLKTFNVSSWTLAAHSDDRTKQFSYCSASTKNSSGIALTYLIDRRYSWRMAFSNPDWSFVPGSIINFGLQIGNEGRFRRSAVARDKQRLEIKHDDSLTLFEMLGNMQTLRLIAGAKEIDFFLIDNGEVLSALVQCVAQLTPQSKNSKRPVANRPIVLQSSVDSPVKFQTEAEALVRKIFNHAGAAEPKISIPDQSASDLDTGVVWELEKLSGTVFVLPAAPGLAMEDQATTTVRGNLQTCQGALFFAASTFAVIDQTKVARVLTRCSTTEARISTYYFIVPRPEGGFYSLSTTSNNAGPVGISRNAARNLDRKIRELIVPLLANQETPAK